MIIYKIENRQTGQIYIGQTINELEKRVCQHYHAKSKVGKEIKKYGIECFDISAIDYANTKQDLDELEKFWISWYRSNIDGYNVLMGGTPSNKEMKMLSKIKKTRKHKHRKSYYNNREMAKDKIYEYIKSYSPKSYKEIGKNTGIKVSILKEVIGNLISDGKIDRIWATKKTYGKYFVALR